MPKIDQLIKMQYDCHVALINMALAIATLPGNNCQLRDCANVEAAALSTAQRLEVYAASATNSRTQLEYRDELSKAV